MKYISIRVSNREELLQAIATPEVTWIELDFLPRDFIEISQTRDVKWVFAMSDFDIFTTHEIEQLITCFHFIEIPTGVYENHTLLNKIPAEKRILSWIGTAKEFKNQQIAKEQLGIEASYHKFIFETDNTGEELVSVQLLHSLNRKDVIAYAVGESSLWTQILSPFLGSPVAPSAFKDSTMLTPYRWVSDYNLPHTYQLESLYGIVGNPVYGSVSPQLHNKTYRASNLPYLYLPFQEKDLKHFFQKIAAPLSQIIPIEGLTVVSPFKEQGMELADACFDPDIKMSGASNLMIHHKKNGWTAHSTDSIGVIEALNLLDKNWQHKRVAVIGCGGAGKTIAARFKKMQIDMTLVNRSPQKAIQYANEIGVHYLPLSAFSPAEFEVIVHATPMGKKGEAPFDLSRLSKTASVIDLVYSLEKETPLIQHCRLLNIKAIDGKRMATIQIAQQYSYMTGLSMEIETKQTENVNN